MSVATITPREMKLPKGSRKAQPPSPTTALCMLCSKLPKGSRKYSDPKALERILQGVKMKLPKGSRK